MSHATEVYDWVVAREGVVTYQAGRGSQLGMPRSDLTALVKETRDLVTWVHQEASAPELEYVKALWPTWSGTVDELIKSAQAMEGSEG